MSDVRESDATPVAVLVSDLHLSHDKPSARAGDRDSWYLTMDRHLSGVLRAARDMKVPVVLAGDVFHTWDQPVELVNYIAGVFAAYSGVSVYLIPGQHDLPYHDAALFHRSALYNLVLSVNGSRVRPDTMQVIDCTNTAYLGNGWVAYGVWWGKDLEVGLDEEQDKILYVGHRYIHAGPGTCHPGAKDSDRYDSTPLSKELARCSAAVFGDNHHPFLRKSRKVRLVDDAYDTVDISVYNHGCLIRRTTNERDIVPEYGVLMVDGSVGRRPVKASEHDTWHDGETEYVKPDTPTSASALDGFSASVRDLVRDESVDFATAVHRLLGDSRLTKAAKREILELLPE